MYNTDSLSSRLLKVMRTYIDSDEKHAEMIAEEAINWATEIVSAIMLEKCCCKNPDVECYFCKLTHEVLKKLEEK